MARMKTSRLTPKTTDPKTGARMANPNTPTGSDAGQGATYLSWPEVRDQYQKGKQEGLITKGTRSEVKNYLQGKTNVLSEEFQEPMVKGGNVQYHYSANESVKKPETNDNGLVSKMPIRKAGMPTTALRKSKEASQKADFNAPKVAIKGGKRVTPGSVVKTANLRGAKPQVDTKNKALSGYNKEARQFKAYAGTTATGESHIAKSAQEISQYKNEMKGMRKEYRKEAPSEIRSMGKAAMTSEIRQARKAERFVKNDNKHFTDKNYGGNIAKDYRESSQNAANRNTMDAKIKAAGAKEKSKAASFGNMPTS